MRYRLKEGIWVEVDGSCVNCEDTHTYAGVVDYVGVSTFVLRASEYEERHQFRYVGTKYKFDGATNEEASLLLYREELL